MRTNITWGAHRCSNDTQPQKHRQAAHFGGRFYQVSFALGPLTHRFTTTLVCVFRLCPTPTHRRAVPVAACGCPSWSIPTRAPPFPRGPDKGKGKVGRSRERGRELLLFFRPSAFDAYRRVPRSWAGGLGPRGETKDGGPATPSPRTLNCRSGGGSTELRRP